ncbi:MAG: succinylglutamate desuccinylase/aspartoacylase family protein [Gammaproteobacteria bacterium]|nr:succinylglutamate desuccinylase/aspartoacylase family protein [Gammaproteobacteria bacterium]
MKLIQAEEPSEDLLDLAASDLHRHFDGPALLRIPGRRQPALFVSVLLHGNEPVGWDAVRELLRRYRSAGEALPRAMTVFIGNVMAAREGLRRLDGQPDYNRIWKGGAGQEVELARELIGELRRAPPFLAVDVHNNTGVNPHYACITRLDPSSLALARRFSRPVVYVRSPDTVLAAALAPMTTAIILEAGRPGERRGVEHVIEYLEACLELSVLPVTPQHQTLDLYETVATVRIRPGTRFDFALQAPTAATTPQDLWLLEEFEHYNFEELSAGTLFGYVPAASPLPLEVTDVADRDVAERYFEIQGQELRLRRDLVPAMFSPDPAIIRQDVVCYFMERVPLH